MSRPRRFLPPIAGGAKTTGWEALEKWVGGSGASSSGGSEAPAASSGVPPTVSKPMPSRFRTVAGSRTMAAISVETRRTISGGVRAGASSRHQVEETKSGTPASANAGSQACRKRSHRGLDGASGSIALSDSA